MVMWGGFSGFGGTPALIDPAASPFVLVEIVLPSSGTQRLARRDIYSQSLGLYEGRIIGFQGEFVWALPDENGNVLTPEVKVLLDDQDRKWFTIIGTGERWQDAAITYKYTLGDGNYTTLMVGRLANVEWQGENRWLLTTRPPDTRLNLEVPREQIDIIDFPDSPTNIRETIVPWMVGSFESRGALSNAGALPTYQTDLTNGKRRLVGAWWVKDIPWIYRNGAVITSSIPTITRTVINGRRYTFLDFTTTQAANTISCDVYGYEDVGDASGNLIQTPGAIMKFLLKNLLLAEPPWGANWRTAAHPNVDDASFDLVDGYMAYRAGFSPYTLGWYLSTRMTGYSMLQKWCYNTGAGLYWSPAGKLTARFLELNSYTQAVGSFNPPVFKWPNDVDQITPEQHSSNPIVAMRGTYLSQPNDGAARYSLSVRDPWSPSQETEDVTFDLGPQAR